MTKKNSMSTGEILRLYEHYKKKGLKNSQIAKEIGITRQYLQYIINSHNKPSIPYKEIVEKKSQEEIKTFFKNEEFDYLEGLKTALKNLILTAYADEKNQIRACEVYADIIIRLRMLNLKVENEEIKVAE
jgi:site-specific recombinase XerD